MADDHRIELPIAFEGGAGTTYTISSEQAWFTTRHPLDIGQRIDGTLRFPPVPDGLATELRFAACVVEVASSLEDDGTFEVWARFEQIEFRAIAVVEHQNGRSAVLPRQPEENHQSPSGHPRSLPSAAENRPALWSLQNAFKRAHAASGKVLARAEPKPVEVNEPPASDVGSSWS